MVISVDTQCVSSGVLMRSHRIAKQLKERRTERRMERERELLPPIRTVPGIDTGMASGLQEMARLSGIDSN